ncbi:hypothetical protein [Desulfobaculum senezii]
MMFYTCKWFRIEELVPPPELLPENMQRAYRHYPAMLFRCFDRRLLVTLDLFRKRYGVFTVNDWPWRGDDPNALRYSGWRPFGCGVGADLSEHYWFRAFDGHFRYVTPQEIWDDMLKNPTDPTFAHVERIEAGAGMSWAHIDVGQHKRYGQAIRVIPGPHGDRAGLPGYIEKVAA